MKKSTSINRSFKYKALKTKSSVMLCGKRLDLQENHFICKVMQSKSSKCLRKVSTIFGLLCISTSVLAVELTPELQLHGYATVGLSKLGSNHGTTYPDPRTTGVPVIESKISAKYNSIAGLQLKYDLNDQIKLVAQGYVAAEQTPETRYTPKVSWAYLDYKFNDEWTLRTGRFAFSTFLWSEHVHVGAAYPWDHLPVEIYGQLGGLYSENGVAVMYKNADLFDGWLLRVQPSIGEEKLKRYQVNDLMQLAVSLSNDDLTLHVGSALADVDVDPVLGAGLASAIDGVLIKKFGYSPTQIDQYNAALKASVRLRHLRTTFSGMGFIYDNNRWFAAGEMTALRFSGVNRDYNAGYISVGHHFEKWLPYVIYAHYKEVNFDELDEIPAPGNAIYKSIAKVDQRTMSVGARYQFRDNTSLKIQADRVDGFHNNFRSGFFLKPKALASSPSTLKSAYVYSVSLNVAF